MMTESRGVALWNSLAWARAFASPLARKSLIDAFRVVEDEDLVSRYRRRMSSLLLV